MMRRVDSYPVEILITLALATAGYALAEALHVSAPIAVVLMGLIVGNRGKREAMSEQHAARACSTSGKSSTSCSTCSCSA